MPQPGQLLIIRSPTNSGFVPRKTIAGPAAQRRRPKVANLAGPSHLDTWSTLVAPRHSRLCNVLMMDASNKEMLPDGMDPNQPAPDANTPSLNDIFWKPSLGLGQ